MTNETMERARARLAKLLEKNSITSGMSIRIHGDHLILGRPDAKAPSRRPADEDRVRLTRLSSRSYGLSVKRHTGRWERTPFVGSMDDMVNSILSFLQHLVASY